MMKKIDDVEQLGKVVVLYGGDSPEREVSLESGQLVYDALIRKGVNAHLIDVSDDVAEQLLKGKFDRAFNIFHGGKGENGVMNGLLEMLKLPYTGSGVEASALAMNKAHAKMVFEHYGVPTQPFQILTKASNSKEVIDKLGLPICVKPLQEGSSVGVSCVKKVAEFQKAYENAAQFKTGVIAEPWISGKEYSAAVLHDQVLPVIEIRSKADFYDYHAKYETETTEFICPCDLTKEEQQAAQTMVLNAFQSLGCYGWGRVDFMRDSGGKFWVLEVNTVPGMSSHSLVPMAAKAVGVDYDELVLQILNTSLNQ